MNQRAPELVKREFGSQISGRPFLHLKLLQNVYWKLLIILGEQDESQISYRSHSMHPLQYLLSSLSQRVDSNPKFSLDVSYF